MIAAMERIKTDGMDVLNMSIGDAFNNWSGSPTAAAADALVDAGIVVVASIGNSGAKGIYSAGAPGVGKKVIGVASYDNTHVQAPGFTLSGDDTAVPYNDSISNTTAIPDPPDPPVSGTFEIKQSDAAAAVGAVPPNAFPGGTTFPDGCAPFPAGFFTGKVALIRRGGPLPPAPAAPSRSRRRMPKPPVRVAVVLYNHSAGGIVPLVAATPQVGIPVVGIQRLDGELIHNRLLSGPVQITWHESVAAVNPTGDLISSFSSYGTEAELKLKPDIGAPGGFIRSTYPARGRRLCHDQRHLDGVAARCRRSRAAEAGPSVAVAPR